MHPGRNQVARGNNQADRGLRKALRPQRSQTTPPRPRGLHPVGALECTHRNKIQPRKVGPLTKKCGKASKRVPSFPLRLGGYCRVP
jgi:hypothetical protein